MTNSVERKSGVAATPSPQTRLQFGVLCGMLLLALIGMGLTQATEKGAWEYWLVVVVIYAALGLWQSTKKAKLDQPLKASIGRQLAHWAILLVLMAVLMLLESREIFTRQAASDFSLLMLALSCCLAGIHFDWPMMIVGVVLTIMAVVMATVQQYSVTLWIIMIAVVVAAAAYFYFRPHENEPSAAANEQVR